METKNDVHSEKCTLKTAMAVCRLGIPEKRDPNRSVSKNWLLVLRVGSYEVNISISTKQKMDNDTLMCTFEVRGYNGEETIIQRGIKWDQFDEFGKCNLIIPYTLETDIPKSELLIIAENGIELLVEEIAWRRAS